MKKELFIYIDGAAKGNPGPAGVGIVIYDDISKMKAPVRQISEYIGQTTNNVAEYLAFIFALQEAVDLKATHLLVYTDSQLLAKQFDGFYKIKNERLKILFAQIQELLKKFEQVEVEQIGRENNEAADKLASNAVKKNKQSDDESTVKKTPAFNSSGPLFS